MKKTYNIPDNEDILIVKTEKDCSIVNQDTNTSNSVVINFYHPITREKLDSSICSHIEISSPVKGLDVNDLNRYNNIRNMTGIDPLNQNDPAFRDRCIPVTDPYSGADTSLNYRLENYALNKTIVCPADCEYDALESNLYATCSCNGNIASKDIANKVQNSIKPMASNLNFDIVRCMNQVFNV
jgi:hypothetical protein